MCHIIITFFKIQNPVPLNENLNYCLFIIYFSLLIFNIFNKILIFKTKLQISLTNH